MRAWYVAKTKPRQESQTSIVLEQRGLEVFFPLIAAPSAPLTRVPAPRLEPLFPGYLFAHLDLHAADWLVARSAPGVAYFLGCPGAPSAVPDELVEQVRNRAAAQRRCGWPARFRAGDRVVFTTGPMAGLEAVFEGRLSPSGRSRVLVEVLGRLVPVVVSEGALRRAG